MPFLSQSGTGVYIRMYTCTYVYISHIYLDVRQRTERHREILLSIKENAAVASNRKKIQQYRSIIYKVDNRSWEQGFASSLPYAFESAVCCFSSSCYLCQMHLLLALGGDKLMVVHGSGTDTSLAACCPRFCSRKDLAPRKADFDPTWPWNSSVCVDKP